METVQPIPAGRPYLLLISKKKITCHLVDFTVASDQRVKIKENKQIDKYLDDARELKRLWYLNETVIPIADGKLGTITENLKKKLDELEIR